MDPTAILNKLNATFSPFTLTQASPAPAALPGARLGAAEATLNDRMYTIGGASGTRTRKAYGAVGACRPRSSPASTR